MHPGNVTAGRGIPEYEIAFEQPKRNRYAVAVFVLNEGEKIRRQLAGMAALADRIDILVADGGSTDGSLTPDYLEANRVTACLVKKSSGGLSTQMRMAFDYVLGKGYEGVVVIDGNGKDGFEAIPRFTELLDEGYDHVQGSRFIDGGVHRNTPLLRYLGVKFLHAPLVSLAAGFRYTDTTNGFRAYSRRLLTDPRVQPFREVFSKYELHYYLAIRAARLGMRVVEVPVARCYPDKGPMPTKISGLRGNFLILKTLFKAVTFRFDP